MNKKMWVLAIIPILTACCLIPNESAATSKRSSGLAKLAAGGALLLVGSIVTANSADTEINPCLVGPCSEETVVSPGDTGIGLLGTGAFWVAYGIRDLRTPAGASERPDYRKSAYAFYTS